MNALQNCLMPTVLQLTGVSIPTDFKCVNCQSLAESDSAGRAKETKWTNYIVTMVKVDETEVYSDLTLHDQEDECDVWLVSAMQGHCVG
jgi:hypothetical protein